MAEDKRPDPEKLLQQIQKSARGRLTVFLGPAAGVGKTYAMLLAAREAQGEGREVVLGWVETHGRPETEALLGGLEQFPPREVEYQGTRLREMDLLGLLARHPQLALVDELAHTNAPGSVHAKRYQDVEDLLAAGTDVFTTVNIQHLESLNDVVAQITGVVVRETVPDRVVGVADEVRLIDLSPDQLIQRLQEGKVYIPAQAQRALHSFFRPGNLNALRELALRHTAETVDAQLGDYMREHGIEGPWPVKERVLVCVGPSPFSADLVRMGRRMASRLRADLIAVSVETRVPLTPEARARLTANMHLAEQLGAETATLYGDHVAPTLADYARSRNVTQIVIGQPLHSRLRDLLRPSPVDSLIRLSTGISVHVIPSPARSKPHRPRPARPPWPLRAILEPLFSVALVSAFCYALSPYLTAVERNLIFLLPVLLSAVRLGRGPAILAAVGGTLALDFLFVPPLYHFSVSDVSYVFTLLMFLAVGLIISTLAARLREEAQAAKDREARTHALYRLGRSITATSSPEDTAQVVAAEVCELFHAETVALLPREDGQLRLSGAAACEGGEAETAAPAVTPEFFDENERATATWVYDHQEPAGAGSDTLAGASAYYVPLRTADHTWGVLGLHRPAPRAALTTDEQHMLEALAGLAGLALERMHLAAEARRAEVFSSAEQFRQTLLDSVSHDLRTPLAAVIGAATSYLEAAEVYDAAGVRGLLETIRDQATLMNDLIEKMLDMARVESGTLAPSLDWCDLQDLVGATLARADLADRAVRADLPPDLPLVRGDFVLLQRVLSNLLDNAVKYSPPGSPVEIFARVVGPEVEIAVQDRGPGIPPEERELVFDKFYRVKTSGDPGGTGLGLSICRGLVEAHGGRIWVEDAAGGGARVVFTLPLTAHQPGPAPETLAEESSP
ncbi:MAG TPA: sensor histidine kinase KdpD [Armatimonadota bacterium]|jgi:two-component system sensor histidine kinase KdpD